MEGIIAGVGVGFKREEEEGFNKLGPDVDFTGQASRPVPSHPALGL